jgi:hypothetical protein
MVNFFPPVRDYEVCLGVEKLFNVQYPVLAGTLKKKLRKKKQWYFFSPRSEAKLTEK